MKIVFATNNKNKLAEIREMLGDKIEVMSLADINCHEDIPETSDTLEGNALQKAHYVYDKYGMSCFADDTGLEVDALGGEPGVYSARYAGGEGHDSEANMAKLMDKLGDNDNRKARFRTVIALITGSGEDDVKLFEGVAEGDIIREKGEERASDTTRYSVPKATTRLLPNWAMRSRTRYLTAPRPCRNSLNISNRQAATNSRLPLCIFTYTVSLSRNCLTWLFQPSFYHFIMCRKNVTKHHNQCNLKNDKLYEEGLFRTF